MAPTPIPNRRREPPPPPATAATTTPPTSAASSLVVVGHGSTSSSVAEEASTNREGGGTDAHAPHIHVPMTSLPAHERSPRQQCCFNGWVGDVGVVSSSSSSFVPLVGGGSTSPQRTTLAEIDAGVELRGVCHPYTSAMTACAPAPAPSSSSSSFSLTNKMRGVRRTSRSHSHGKRSSSASPISHDGSAVLPLLSASAEASCKPGRAPTPTTPPPRIINTMSSSLPQPPPTTWMPGTGATGGTSHHHYAGTLLPRVTPPSPAAAPSSSTTTTTQVFPRSPPPPTTTTTTTSGCGVLLAPPLVREGAAPVGVGVGGSWIVGGPTAQEDGAHSANVGDEGGSPSFMPHAHRRTSANEDDGAANINAPPPTATTATTKTSTTHTPADGEGGDDDVVAVRRSSSFKDRQRASGPFGAKRRANAATTNVSSPVEANSSASPSSLSPLRLSPRGAAHVLRSGAPAPPQEEMRAVLNEACPPTSPPSTHTNATTATTTTSAAHTVDGVPAMPALSPMRMSSPLPATPSQQPQQSSSISSPRAGLHNITQAVVHDNNNNNRVSSARRSLASADGDAALQLPQLLQAPHSHTNNQNAAATTTTTTTMDSSAPTPAVAVVGTTATSSSTTGSSSAMPLSFATGSNLTDVMALLVPTNNNMMDVPGGGLSSSPPRSCPTVIMTARSTTSPHSGGAAAASTTSANNLEASSLTHSGLLGPLASMEGEDGDDYGGGEDNAANTHQYSTVSDGDAERSSAPIRLTMATPMNAKQQQQQQCSSPHTHHVGAGGIPNPPPRPTTTTTTTSSSCAQQHAGMNASATASTLCSSSHRTCISGGGVNNVGGGADPLSFSANLAGSSGATGCGRAGDAQASTSSIVPPMAGMTESSLASRTLSFPLGGFSATGERRERGKMILSRSNAALSRLPQYPSTASFATEESTNNTPRGGGHSGEPHTPHHLAQTHTAVDDPLAHTHTVEMLSSTFTSFAATKESGRKSSFSSLEYSMRRPHHHGIGGSTRQQRRQQQQRQRRQSVSAKSPALLPRGAGKTTTPANMSRDASKSAIKAVVAGATASPSHPATTTSVAGAVCEPPPMALDEEYDSVRERCGSAQDDDGHRAPLWMEEEDLHASGTGMLKVVGTRCTAEHVFLTSYEVVEMEDHPGRTSATITTTPTTTAAAMISAPVAHPASSASGNCGGSGEVVVCTPTRITQQQQQQQQQQQHSPGFSMGSASTSYNVDPTQEAYPPADCKIHARLRFDAEDGVLILAPRDEVEKYLVLPRPESEAGSSPTASPLSTSGGVGSAASAGDGRCCGGAAASCASMGDGDGACQCSEERITKDTRGMDYSKYNAHELYACCSVCKRRPASFLCLCCFTSFCPSHVSQHYASSPNHACGLYLNILDIMTSFDRVFWCEVCQRFTWKYTEIYDALVDQVAYTRGTYLSSAARDLHCVGYETCLATREEEEATMMGLVSNTARTSPTSHVPPHAGEAAEMMMPSVEYLQHALLSPLHSGDFQQEGEDDDDDGGACVVGGVVHPHLFLTPEQLVASPQSPTTTVFSQEDERVGVVPIGTAVTALSAISVSVQGWRSTQEDAESVFTVIIPSLHQQSLTSTQDNLSFGSAVAAAYASPLLSRRNSLPLTMTAAASPTRSIDAETIPMAVYCIFDGHGGDAVAKLAAARFEQHLHQAIQRSRPEDVRARALLCMVKSESYVGRGNNNNNNSNNPRGSYGRSNYPSVQASPCSSPKQLPRLGSGAPLLRPLPRRSGVLEEDDEVLPTLSPSVTAESLKQHVALLEQAMPPTLLLPNGPASPVAAMMMRNKMFDAADAHHDTPPARLNGLTPSTTVSLTQMEMLRTYFASIMEDALLSLDDELLKTEEGSRGDYSNMGCTACVVGITSNFILCANLGDSGAAFFTAQSMEFISKTHRVGDEAETTRILGAGYAIERDRIEGMLAVPRALGDFDFKQCGGKSAREQAVCAVPEVSIRPVPSDGEGWGVLLACDGVWDTATRHQVHYALINTENDLEVSASATAAVLRAQELLRMRCRGGNDGLMCDDGSMATSCGGGVGGGVGGINPRQLVAAAGILAQCVAPADNDEGIGLDNCSLILVEPNRD